MIEAVDLFCGAGGLTRGLIDSGISVKAGYDLDPTCKYPYEKNNKGTVFVEESVKDLKPKQVASWFSKGAPRLLAGCAPCQPFSSHRKGVDTSGEEDWSLLDSFRGIVAGVKPEFVTMENVVPLQRHTVFTDFVRSLTDLGYEISYQSVYCPIYGIAQERRRLVLLGSRVGAVELAEATHDVDTYLTVEQLIGELPKLKAGETDPNDPLHTARKLSPTNLQRIKASKPGGTWRDWPEELRSACHRKDSGSTFQSVYARMWWNRPSPTITTQFYNFGTGRFGHPQQDRALSLREGALLQSFPAGYKFLKNGAPAHRNSIGRLIGNAVPPKLGEAIGRSFLSKLG